MRAVLKFTGVIFLSALFALSAEPEEAQTSAMAKFPVFYENSFLINPLASVPYLFYDSIYITAEYQRTLSKHFVLSLAPVFYTALHSRVEVVPYLTSKNVEVISDGTIFANGEIRESPFMFGGINFSALAFPFGGAPKGPYVSAGLTLFTGLKKKKKTYIDAYITNANETTQLGDYVHQEINDYVSFALEVTLGYQWIFGNGLMLAVGAGGTFKQAEWSFQPALRGALGWSFGYPRYELSDAMDAQTVDTRIDMRKRIFFLGGGYEFFHLDHDGGIHSFFEYQYRVSRFMSFSVQPFYLYRIDNKDSSDAVVNVFYEDNLVYSDSGMTLLADNFESRNSTHSAGVDFKINCFPFGKGLKGLYISIGGSFLAGNNRYTEKYSGVHYIEDDQTNRLGDRDYESDSFFMSIGGIAGVGYQFLTKSGFALAMETTLRVEARELVAFGAGMKAGFAFDGMPGTRKNENETNDAIERALEKARPKKTEALVFVNPGRIIFESLKGKTFSYFGIEYQRALNRYVAISFVPEYHNFMRNTDGTSTVTSMGKDLSAKGGDLEYVYGWTAGASAYLTWFILGKPLEGVYVSGGVGIGVGIIETTKVYYDVVYENAEGESVSWGNVRGEVYEREYVAVHFNFLAGYQWRLQSGGAFSLGLGMAGHSKAPVGVHVRVAVGI